MVISRGYLPMTELRCIVSSVSVGLPGVYSSSLELSPPPATTTSAHTHTQYISYRVGVHTVHIIQGGGYTQYVSYRVGGTHGTYHTGWGVHSTYHTGWGVHTVCVIQGGGYTTHLHHCQETNLDRQSDSGVVSWLP